jgi:hypothetical protein
LRRSHKLFDIKSLIISFILCRYAGIPAAFAAAHGASAPPDASPDATPGAAEVQRVWESAKTLRLEITSSVAGPGTLSGRARFIGRAAGATNAAPACGAVFAFDQTAEGTPLPPQSIGILRLSAPMAMAVACARQLASAAISPGADRADRADRADAVASAALSPRADAGACDTGISMFAAATPTEDASWDYLPTVQTLIVGDADGSTTMAAVSNGSCVYRFADCRNTRRSKDSAADVTANVCRGVWVETVPISRVGISCLCFFVFFWWWQSFTERWS